MLYLIASIICSVILGFLFKLFPKFGVHTLQAIVVNYFVCVASASVHIGHFPVEKADFSANWMPYALGLGLVFITGFNAAALTVQYFSVTISQIMQRMSILLSVPFAIIAYHESAGWVKISGFIFALAAIILINLTEEKKEKGNRRQQVWMIVLPLITWILASVIEIVFLKVQNEKMIAFGDVSFISTVFGTAGILGTLYVLFLFLQRKIQFSWRNVLAGLVLGIPNYGSMYFILQGLSSGLEGSFFFPVNNVGIILVTALGALVLFKDRFSLVNWIGIFCAVLAIFLLGS